jgi:hypothetical protein
LGPAVLCILRHFRFKLLSHWHRPSQPAFALFGGTPLLVGTSLPRRL